MSDVPGHTLSDRTTFLRLTVLPVGPNFKVTLLKDYHSSARQ